MRRMIRIAMATAVFLMAAAAAHAAGVCPQERKTPSAPPNIVSMDNTGAADIAKGKDLYEKSAKPMACKNCHGDAGAGDGKVGANLKPLPLNFTCADTVKNISAGQMFWIVKNGSPNTGMPPFQSTLKDDEIWSLVKYIRGAFVK